jgi:hypothetical protein
MQYERAKKTLFGLGLTGAGLSAMFVSPTLGTALGLSQVVNIGSYFLVYLLGFVSLLTGVGHVLIANNLWGEMRR